MEGGLTQSIAEMASSLANSSSDDLLHDARPSKQREDSPHGEKRKSEDGQPQQRAKRNRYISIACNECKRRKIKCNGQTPCQRCGNLNLDCVYAPNCCNGFKDSLEFKQMSDHISGLQDQISMLWDNVNAMRAQLGGQGGLPSLLQQHSQHQTPIDPSLQAQSYPAKRNSFSGAHPSPGGGAPVAPMSPSMPKSSSQAHQPRFRGPTSSQFNFSVAKSSLQTMGITSRQQGQEEQEDGSANEATGTRDDTPDGSEPTRSQQLLPSMHRDKDPIWRVSKEDTIRLCRAYDDEAGMMYPVVNIEQVLAHADKLYRFMEAAHRTGLMQQGMPGTDGIEDDDTNILKLVLATAMTVEECGRSETGRRLFEFVQPAIDRMLLGSVGVKGLRVLTLAAMYEFHRDNEGTSWRIIGLTARLCVELGLHRSETYETMQDESERDETLLLFWAIYVLDRRWSFGTGMPFSLQDGDIDARLPRPEDKSPYLSAMIGYSLIASKVWHSVAARSALQEVNQETMGYLDYQVIQWHRNIPKELRFEHPAQTSLMSTPLPPPKSRSEHRARTTLYLRANSMRIQIYRPVLHSATMIIKHRDQAQTVVDVAKDTIRVLTHINQTTDLYRSQQVLFNAFLTGALAVLFLAVSHTPAIFAENVRDEFYMALDLVRGLSKGSWVSKRLWKTIRVLKEVGPQLGLPARDGDSQIASRRAIKGGEDPSRSAAVAMAGLAGHNVDELALYNGSGAQPWASASLSSNSPDGIANDLSSLFEAAGGFQANGNLGTADGYNGENVSENVAAIFGGEEGLSNILKELF